MGRLAVDEATEAGDEAPVKPKQQDGEEQWHNLAMQQLQPELQESVGRFQLPSVNAFGLAFRYIHTHGMLAHFYL